MPEGTTNCNVQEFMCASMCAFVSVCILVTLGLETLISFSSLILGS